MLALISSPSLRVLQFYEPLPKRLLQALNEDFFPYRPEVELRAYGFYGESCDLSFCEFLSNVRRFRADCIQSATGVENLTRMRGLRTLGIGIFNLDSFDFLADISANIEDLTLSQTKSKGPDLKYLARFRFLTRLCLAGQQKGIEVLAGHPSLEELCLRSITLPSLRWVRALPKLWLLDLGLGGTKDLSALAGLEQLKSLDLWKILGLEDLSVLASLTGLQKLQLQELTRIQRLPALGGLKRLRRVILDNLKSLTDVTALMAAPSVAELAHYSAKIDPEDYIPLFRQGKLTHAQMGFGGKKKNERFTQICSEYRITTGPLAEFVFS